MFSELITPLNERLAPAQTKYKYNYGIEQYRGVCALLVLITHGLGDPGLLVNNFLWPSFVGYLGAGYLSVLVFFCISGYVIGITNYSDFNTVQYLKKRAVRLYPTYLVALALCIFIAGKVNILVLIGNLLFLQNESPYIHFSIPVFVNYAAWSLNNEALYYLLFIFIVLLRPKLWKIALALLLLTIVLIPAPKTFLFLGSFVGGYYLWLLGLLIGWNIIRDNTQESIKPFPLLSILFLHLCQNHLNIGQMVFNLAGFEHSPFSILIDIPFCLMVMCVLTGKYNKFLRLNKVVAYLLPAGVFIYLAINGRLFENIRWIMCLIYWVLALSFHFEKKVSTLIMKRLTFIGQISYGLYLLHIPVALVIKKTIFISNQTLEVFIKYCLWIGLTFMLAFMLEMRLQPAVKKYFSR